MLSSMSRIDLHAGHARVVGDVQLVFDVLGDGQQDAGVALPQEDALQSARVVVGHELGQLAAVVGQQDHRDVQPRLPDLARQLGGVHVAHVHGRDDEVEAALARWPARSPPRRWTRGVDRWCGGG